MTGVLRRALGGGQRRGGQREHRECPREEELGEDRHGGWGGGCLPEGGHITEAGACRLRYPGGLVSIAVLSCLKLDYREMGDWGRVEVGGIAVVSVFELS